jgi:hypothetical protein
MLLKTKVINFNDFVSGKYSADQKAKKERRNKIIKTTVKVSALSTVIFLGSYDFAGAASSGIDIHARELYNKLLLVGKWIIIIKGAIDTINNVVQGDFGTAKRSFLGYLVVYMILNGLPWAMDEVDGLFAGMGR